MKNDKYLDILAGHTRSRIQEFERYLRTEIGLIEDGIRLVLHDFNSNFVTSDLQTGIYIFRDLSEVVFNILQPEYLGPTRVSDIEFDDLTMKTKLVVRSGIKAIRFDEKLFF